VRRSPVAFAALAASALWGCPLPQAVPAVGRNGQVLVPAPRIVYELLSPQSTVVDVAKTCPAAPQFTLSASVSDENTIEAVEARWFVDYDAMSASGIQAFSFPEPDPADPSNPRRAVDPFIFAPVDWEGPGYALHVVELVVSNGFRVLGEPGLRLPNRTPQDGYETQVFRWVFRYVDPPGGLCAFPLPP
jgi:hypothetical protein